MAKFATTIRATDPITGEILTYSGPEVEAKTWSAAERYCQENGLGYCKVTAIIRESPVLSDADMAEVAPELK